jgi:phage major head subunit gpT-like protein
MWPVLRARRVLRGRKALKARRVLKALRRKEKQMDINAANLDLLYRAAANNFQGALTGSPTIYQDICTTMPMSTRQVTQAWMDKLPMMRKWVGNRVVNSANAKSKPYEAVPYEHTFGLSKWDIMDDLLGVFNMAVQMQGEAVAKQPDQLLWDFTQVADEALGYDGVPVYSEAHPILGGIAGGVPGGTPAVQSNLFTETPLTYDNYVSVRAQMRSWKGADGAPLLVMPNLLMVPPSLEGQAKLILEADFLSNVAGNTTAPQSNTYKGTSKILVNPWMADWATNWFMFDVSKVIKPFADNELTAPSFTYLTSPTDPNVFQMAEFLYGAERRNVVCETVWWLGAACTAETTYVPA